MKTLNFDYDNLGGVIRLFAIPAVSFLRIREDYVSGLKYPELRKRELIIDIPVYADDSFSIDEEHKLTNQGDTYDTAVSGIIPKMCRVNATTLEILERGEWMVLTQDSNGEVRLTGSPENLLKFTCKKSTGKTKAARNGIEFSFAATLPQTSVYVDVPDFSTI